MDPPWPPLSANSILFEIATNRGFIQTGQTPGSKVSWLRPHPSAMCGCGWRSWPRAKRCYCRPCHSSRSISTLGSIWSDAKFAASAWIHWVSRHSNTPGSTQTGGRRDFFSMAILAADQQGWSPREGVVTGFRHAGPRAANTECRTARRKSDALVPISHICGCSRQPLCPVLRHLRRSSRLSSIRRWSSRFQICSVLAAARAAGIHRSRHYDWLKKDSA